MKTENWLSWIQIDKDEIIRKEKVSGIVYDRVQKVYNISIDGAIRTYSKAAGEKILKAFDIKP